jgi:hypothetical protein
MRCDIPSIITDGDFVIKLNYEKGNYNFCLECWELFYKNKLIEQECDWDSPAYLFRLKDRLKKGQKLNWFTKFKARWW